MNIDFLKAAVSDIHALADNPDAVRSLAVRMANELAKAGEREQKEVYANVRARGYIDGWELVPRMARQVCKMGEELGELAGAVTVPGFAGPFFPDWVRSLQKAAAACKAAFDDARAWENVRVDTRTVGKEIPDILVPAFCLAEDMKVDAASLAVEKSAADIRRGVRRDGGVRTDERKGSSG